MITVYLNRDNKYEIFVSIAKVGEYYGGFELNKGRIDKIVEKSKERCSQRKMVGAFLIGDEFSHSPERSRLELISHFVEEVFVIENTLYCHIKLIETNRGKLLRNYLDQYLTKNDDSFEVRNLSVDCIGSKESFFDDDYELMRVDILCRG